MAAQAPSQRDVSAAKNDAAALVVNVLPRWAHFVAGGCGGMTGALLTCPLELVKTRMQSAAARQLTKSGLIATMRDMVEAQGIRGLFKGLGPTLFGVAPSRAMYFSSYSFLKSRLSALSNSEGSSLVHLASAAGAGIFVASIMNPVWVVKTRLQLQLIDRSSTRVTSRDIARQVWREDGPRGFYRGITASYIGVSEGTVQFVIYERFKSWYRAMDAARTGVDKDPDWLTCFGLASGAKFIASTATYPHEVVRTRLREVGARTLYTGFWNCMKVVYQREGIRALYGGLLPHLLRVVPNSAIMFSVYELVLSLIGRSYGVPDR